jgi:uncharacterized protein
MSDRILDRFQRMMGDSAAREGEATGESAPPVDDIERQAQPRPGVLVSTPYGPVRVLEERRTTAYPYSARLMEELLVTPVTDSAGFLKDERVHGFSRDEALFLDVETTGLSHGAGTVAFLIGLAWFEEDEFVVRQLLLDDYDQEQAQLHLLLEQLGARRYLVTYNGKSFDRSVLESRLVIQRFMDHREAHLRLMPHLDLLHVGRRVFGGLLENHRLATLEREILGFHRPDDIPGEMVPQYYFQYMLSGCGEHIEGVLKHNFDDVLSLAHLAHTLLEAIAPSAATRSPRVAFNLGKLHATGRDWARARVRLEEYLQCRTESPEILLKAAHLLARCHRQLKAPAETIIALWTRVAEELPEAPEPWTRLAILHERTTRQLDRALRCAERALHLDPRSDDARKRAGRLRQRVECRPAPSTIGQT